MNSEEITRNDLKVTFSLALQIAKADDELSMLEKRLLFQLFDKIRPNDEEKAALLKKGVDAENNLNQLSSDSAKELLLMTLCAVAHSDGLFHYSENEYLNRVVTRMGKKIEIPAWEEWLAYEQAVLDILNKL